VIQHVQLTYQDYHKRVTGHIILTA